MYFEHIRFFAAPLPPAGMLMVSNTKFLHHKLCGNGKLAITETWAYTLSYCVLPALFTNMQTIRYSDLVIELTTCLTYGVGGWFERVSCHKFVRFSEGISNRFEKFYYLLIGLTLVECVCVGGGGGRTLERISIRCATNIIHILCPQVPPCYNHWLLVYPGMSEWGGGGAKNMEQIYKAP